jgi:hypothetical protein
MHKLIILITALSLSACTTMPEGKHQIDAKMVVGTVALIAVAGYLGKENQKSKCANNRAGFWQDTYSGRIYTCP